MRALAAVLLAPLALLAACSSSPARVTSGAPQTELAATSRSDAAAAANLQLGIEYMRQGNLATAQQKLQRALAQNPRDPNIHAVLGLLSSRTGDARAADEHFRTALRLAPHNPDIENNYAGFLCEQGRVDEGVKLFEEAAHDPLYRTPEFAYTNAGVCLRKAKRYADAERDLQRALTLQASYQEALLQLGELYLETNRVSDARARIDRYLETFPETAEILWLGVRAARADGDRLAEERYARKLRVDFPQADQTRKLAAQGRGG